VNYRDLRGLFLFSVREQIFECYTNEKPQILMAGFHKVVRASAHTLKTANIKIYYDPRSRLWYYKAYNLCFLRPYHTQILLQASIP
jgi:hypothetical protein